MASKCKRRRLEEENRSVKCGWEDHFVFIDKNGIHCDFRIIKLATFDVIMKQIFSIFDSIFT